MEVFGHDGNKVLWEVFNDHVIGEPTDNDEIGLLGFDLNMIDGYEKRVGREGSIELTYLIMLIKLWSCNLNTENHFILLITHSLSDMYNDITEKHAKRASSSAHGQSVTSR